MSNFFLIRLMITFSLALISYEVYAEIKFVIVKPAFRQITITGFTHARSIMPLTAEISGKIIKVYADIGDQIPKSGVFTCADDTFIKFDINTTKNDISQHYVDIKYYKNQVERHQLLVDKKSIAVSLLEDFLRKHKNAQHELQKAKIKLNKLIETLNRHCVHAPNNWRVIEKYVEPGQWVSAGENVAKVGNYSRLLIPISLTNTELEILKSIENLKVFLPEFNQEVEAKIELISPAFDEQSRKINVDLVIEKELPAYRGGLRADLRLNLPDEFGALLIPKQAIDERFEEYWVERIDGKKIKVILLEYLKDDLAKITSPEINSGDEFKILRR